MQTCACVWYRPLCLTLSWATLGDGRYPVPSSGLESIDHQQCGAKKKGVRKPLPCPWHSTDTAAAIDIFVSMSLARNKDV